MMRSWRTSIVTGGLSLALVLGACGKKEEGPSAPSSPRDAPADKVEAAPAEDPPAAEGEGEAREQPQPRRGIDDDPAKADRRPDGPIDVLALGEAVELGAGPQSAPFLGYLPTTTYGAVVLASPRAVLDAIAFDAIEESLGAAWKEDADELRAVLGVDPTTPAGWEAAGVDLGKAAGFAAIDRRRQAFAAALTLSDAGKVRALIDGFVEKESANLAREEVDGSVVYVVGEGRQVAGLIRGDALIWVWSEGRDAAAADLARAMARQDPAASFARAKDFTGTVTKLEGQAAILLWGNLRLLVEAALPYRRGPGDARKAYREALVDPLSAVAVGVRFGERAITADGVMPLPRSALIRRLFRNGAGLPAALAATTRDPLYAMGGQIDVAALRELTDLVLRMDRTSLGELESAASDLLGVNIETQLFGALTGEAGVVVTGDLERGVVDEGSFLETLDGSLVVGLKDPAAMGDLLAATGEHELLKDFVRYDAEARAIIIPTPIGKQVRVQVAGRFLLITSDAGLAARITAGDMSGSFVTRLTHPELRERLVKGDMAAYSLTPQALLAGFLLYAGASMEAGVGGGPPADMTDAQRAAYEELVEVRGQLEAKAEERDRVVEKEMIAALRDLGVTAQLGRVTDDGIAFHVGQYLEAPVSGVVSRLVATQARAEALGAEVEALRERAWELERKAGVGYGGGFAPFDEEPLEVEHGGE